MKKILFLYILIGPLLASAQYTENFNDGDFTSNPTWSGDVGKWQVNNFQLQSNSAIANDTFYLSTPLVFADSGQWEIWIKLDYSTSSANFVDVYMVADNPDLKASFNGYFVRLGGTPDEISLYRRDALAVTKLIDGIDGRSQTASSNNVFKIKVVCNAGGLWSLSDDITGTGNSYLLEGQVTDVTYTTGSYTGISVKQSTASFFNKHYFDDLYAGPIIQDTVAPVILNVLPLTASTLDVHFSETVAQAGAETPSNYAVSNGIGNPFSAQRDATDKSLVHLGFSGAFSSGILHTLSTTNVTDLSGNALAVNTTTDFTYYQTSTPMPGDILINEVLFNARDGGVEFVELYNASQKVIDLKDVRFTREDLSTHILDAPVNLATVTRLLLPGEYIVLSDDSAIVKSQYHTENPDAFLNMALPDLLTTEDILLLLNPASLVIDQLHYYESWQFPLLNTVDGIALERIRFSDPTQLETNWHSAAETVGFATPGYRNSQYVPVENDGSEVSVVPEVFSPDDDGTDDVMSLYYTFSEPGFIANANVYDARGRLIRKMAENVMLGTTGSLLWDGLSDSREKARTGIYVVYLEVFNAKGEVKKFKRSCVVATKL